MHKKCLHHAALLAAVFSCMSLPATAAEPTEDMRSAARLFAALEARDQPGFCETMHGPAYLAYLGRVCQLAVQNKLRQPEECSTEALTQEARDDKKKCLSMSAAEFDERIARGRGGREKFVKDMAAQGVDGEKLIREARSGKTPAQVK